MTTDSAAPLMPWVRDTPTSPGTRSWLTRLSRWLRTATLSPTESALLDTVRNVAAHIGTPVLEARTASEVAERIDAVAENPMLVRFNARVIELMTIEMVVDAFKEGERVPEALVDALGEGPAGLVAGAYRLEASIASAIVQWRISFGDDALLAEAKDLEARFPGFFYDPGVPSAVQLAVFSGLRANVAALSMAQAVLTSRKLEPWMALRLAESYRDGLLGYLRLLAALPFVFVPTDLIPPGERLDLGTMLEAHARSISEIDELVAQAEAAGGEQSFVAVADDP